MTSQFTPNVSQILAFSREEAARLASRSVAPEHLLLGLLRMKEGPVADIFGRMKLDTQSVKYALEQRVREDNLSVPVDMSDLVLNEKANNVMKLAVLEARIQHTQQVDQQHLLLALLHDQAMNGARQILEQNNMNYEQTLNMLHAPQESGVKNGIGLPEGAKEDMFDPVVSDDDPGVCLSIVKDIVTAHGGTVTGDNNAGGGSVFTITLPLEQPEEVEEAVLMDEE